MDLRRRMEILSESARDDRDGVPRPHQPIRVGARPLASVGIAAVRVPGGGTTNLMRVMQTNACSLSCGYCPTFCGGKVPRATISPEETARTFMEVHRKGLAQGLFLTSGVPGRPVSRGSDRRRQVFHSRRTCERAPARSSDHAAIDSRAPDARRRS